MATSASYYTSYQQQTKIIKQCEKNIKALQTILGTLYKEFYDEQQAVNSKLENLEEDLSEAVRNNTKFNMSISQCAVQKETSSTVDANLKKTIDALESELTALNTEKETAESQKTAFYTAYKNAKEEERKEYLEQLKSMLSKGGT